MQCVYARGEKKKKLLEKQKSEKGIRLFKGDLDVNTSKLLHDFVIE